MSSIKWGWVGLTIYRFMLQKICSFIVFTVLGWKVEGQLPTENKLILAGLPHTSNWDFPIAWLAITALGLKMNIFVKDVYHTWPLNYVCNFFGALPVNRRKSTRFVDAVVEQFATAETLRLVIAPEGTRKFSPKLKSGYYYIAKAANIPIVLAAPNYKEKTYTFMPARAAMETFEEDEQNLIEFCKKIDGKYPKNSF